MKTRVKLAVGAGLVLVGLVLGFLLRDPVLIVSDEPFVALYGTKRIRAESIRVSLVLRRRVKQVVIAEGAGSDVLVFALEEAASRPFCVIFPRRFAAGARRFNDEFPGIPVVLLTGRIEPGNGEDDARENFFQFSNDAELDFYRAGLCAAVLAGAGADTGATGGADGVNGAGVPRGTLLDRGVQGELRASFVRGLREQGIEADPVFDVNVADTETRAPAAVIMSGAGADYLDRNSGSPIVLFTWLDPGQTSRETMVIFDDSPWAQAAAAARMVGKNQKKGKFPSKVLIFPARVADNGVLRGLKKAARAVPEEKNAVTDVNDLTKN